MQNSPVKMRIETQPAPAQTQGSNPKSKFNDAEYERWNEKLRNRNASKGK